MNEANLRKLAVDINRAPTMMVMTVWKEVICKPATYHPREGWQIILLPRLNKSRLTS